MNIKHSEILPRVIHLEFDTQEELMSTFMRFQEFYESPKFKGTLFTRQQYKEWYTKEYGEFTYFTDWSGCNVPCSVFRSSNLMTVDFNKQEVDLMKVIQPYLNAYNNCYFIGTYGDSNTATLNHEIAHALYYTNPSYKDDIDSLMAKLPQEYVTDRLIELKDMGYHSSVLVDEMHAYIVESDVDLDFTQEVEMRKIFESYATWGSRFI